jgi:pyruvate-formate lyase-activating enzyme
MDKNTLYRLQWEKFNNPNGWIEPTTYCQLKCPNCYRGLDQKGFVPAHVDIESVFREINMLIEKRNIQTLTIAGGEPLMYPELDRIITYTKSRNCNVMILTNGLLLTKERLLTFKELGVDRIVIHIDKYQKVEGRTTEEEVNIVRERFCNMFRDVPEVSLGFIMPLASDNIPDLKIVIDFFKKNSDVVKLVTFTLLQEGVPDSLIPEGMLVHENGIFNTVKEIYCLEYCAYLGKSKSDGISWLFAHALFSGNKYLGAINKRICRAFHEYYRKKEKRNLITTNSYPKSASFFFKLLTDASFYKIAVRWLKSRKKINMQTLIIVHTPTRYGDEWDLCDGCPDAIYHNGKLVPSCFLERVKAGESIEAC